MKRKNKDIIKCGFCDYFIPRGITKDSSGIDTLKAHVMSKHPREYAEIQKQLRHCKDESINYYNKWV